MYRDVWPLCTFTLTPVDAAEGWLLWSKVALLIVAAVIIPLVMPRLHTPIDAEVSSFSTQIVSYDLRLACLV